MGKKLKIAIVGIGHAANDFHLPCLRAFEDVEIVLCEHIGERLRKACATWDIPPERAFANIDEMLNKSNPDGVYVLVPQYQRTVMKSGTPYIEFSRKVMERGKAIFVEKPLGVDTAQACEMLKIAQKNGVKVTMCGYQRRFNPLLLHGLRLVRERGPLLNCQFSFFKGETAQNNDEQAIENHNWLTLDMIHCLDLMRCIPEGEITDFFSTTGTAPGSRKLTEFHAMAKFSSGTTGVFTSNVRAGARVLRFELHGNNISVYIMTAPEDPRVIDHRACSKSSMEALIYRDFTVNRGNIRPEKIHVLDVAPNHTANACAGFWDQSRNFVDCIKSGRRTKTPFEDAYETNVLAEKILEKASGQKSVIL